MIVNIKDIISPAFYKYWANPKMYNLSEGGRASFKSSVHGLELAEFMIDMPNTDLIVLRENYKDHKDTTFSELLIAFKRLGINLVAGVHYPRGNQLWIQLPNGSRARFYGGVSNDYENLKGIVPTPGNIIRLVWFFEITQFKTEYALNQVISSFMRGNKDVFHMFFEWNPPEQKGHWVHEWRDNVRERDTCNYIFINYLDHPIELQVNWLGEALLAEIEALKIIDEDQYKNIYLGETVALGGRIYKKFDRELHTIEIDEEYLDNLGDYIPMMYVGVDPGYRDKFVVTATILGKNFSTVDIVETMVIDNVKRQYTSTVSNEFIKGVEYDPNECVQKAFYFLTQVKDKYKFNIRIDIDSADKGLRMLFKTYISTQRIQGMVPKAVNKTKKFEKSQSAIQERIRFSNILIGANKLKINNKCKHLIYAFEDAIKDKNGNRKDDQSTDFNDSLDSFEYSILDNLKNIQTRVLFIEGQKMSRSR